jgi:putative DNA methylase
MTDDRKMTLRRLIEHDFPVSAVSVQARKEKSLRRGQIAPLHVWWARRPLAACRAVALATLLPDPTDANCPTSFRIDAAHALKRFRDVAGGPPVDDSSDSIRDGLLRFVARFAEPRAAVDPLFLNCARELVLAAFPDGPPLVVDPFGGGGAIPLEVLRLGADAWACDYSPVAALLLRSVIEDIPRYGDRLAETVRSHGSAIRDRVEASIGHFHRRDSDGGVPIAYLWARTVTCEGPGCGADIPLIRQLWLARGKRPVALKLVVDRDARTIDFELERDAGTAAQGTVRAGAAICPVCQAVTPVSRVRAQATAKRGLPVRMIALVRTFPGRQGRHYRIATAEDRELAGEAEKELRRREAEHRGSLSLVPDEPLPPEGTLGFRIQKYGLQTWGDLFLPRQALALTSLVEEVRASCLQIREQTGDASFSRAVALALATCVDRAAENLTSLCRWNPVGEKVQGTFGRQALPMVWDCAEVNPFGGSVGDWDSLIENWLAGYETAARVAHAGTSTMGDARALPHPDNSVAFVFTDPPYYDAVPYADLSDFFYVWLRRSVGDLYPSYFGSRLAPRSGEIIVSPVPAEDGAPKDRSFFEGEMRRALIEARRALAPDGIAVLVFAHKTTSGWEAMLQALLDAGWTVTGSWPLDTEMATRLRARDSAALASSVHIVCRPRPDDAGIGSWREVRPELERRIGEWLPRLAEEGIEGADAIFACLGPALEAYSRFARVETAAGDLVPLSPPLEDPDAPALLPAVWAAVAHTAFTMLFDGAEAEGFEEDARLTALWLWTLKAGTNGAVTASDQEGTDNDDTARKLAQALGADLEALDHPDGIVELKGSTARLRSVMERRRKLTGADTLRPSSDVTLFERVEHSDAGSVIPGATTLDRVHQAMLLFGDGRGDALRRLLSQPGYVSDERFMRLARSLSALYPPSSSEKRWLDGVLSTRLR